MPSRSLPQLGRYRVLVWLLASAGTVSVALLLVALQASIVSTHAFQDVNLSGSLRYRSLWIYGSVQEPGDSGQAAQLDAMAGIRERLRVRYPAAVAGTDPQWSAFAGSVRRTGHVDWQTADAMRLAADGQTKQIAARAAAQNNAAALLLRLGLIGLIFAGAASGLLLAGLRTAETEMQRALSGLQDSQDLFLQSINAVQEGYMVQDRDGVILLCNAGAERLLGMTAHSLVGQPAVQPGCRFLRENGEDFPRDQHPSRLALQTGEPQEEVVLGIRRPGRETTWFLMKAAPVFLAGQTEAYAAVLTFTDITARKKIEEEQVRIKEEQARIADELQRQREFQQAMLESLHSGVVACDAAGILTLFNRAAREFHGLPEQPLPPDQWTETFDLYRPDGVTPLPTEEIPLFRAFAGEVVRDVEMVIAPRGGPSRTLLASGQAIFGADGRKIGAVAAMHDITARRRVERELSRLAAIVESSEEAILASTLDGTLVSWNAGAERLYGYSEAEIIGQHASVLALPGEISPFDKVLPRLLRGESVEPIEVVRRRPDGVTLNVSLSFSPIYNADDCMVGVSCISRDITAAKKAEEALRESEAKLRYLSGAAFEGIAVSRAGVIVDANPAFLTLYGYDTVEDVIGLPPEAFAALEARALVREKVSTADENTYEVLCQRRDGTTFQAEVRGRNILWDGFPARVSAVRDVTERRTMEEALQESQRFAHSIAENSASIIFVFDLETRSNVYSNRDVAEFLGYTPQQIVEWGDALLPSIIHPDDLPRLMVHLAGFQTLADGEVVEFEYRARHASGDWHWIWNREVVFKRSPDGVPRQILGNAQDVTVRRETEEALRLSETRFRESEARLAEAQRIAQVGSWEFDLVENKISWSSELFRLFGLDPAGPEPDYAGAVALYHPDDAPKLDALVARAAQEGIGYTLDLRGAPEPGRPQRWFHTVGNVVADPSGKIVRLLGTLADITERKALEAEQRDSTERLRQSEEALRALMSSAPVILYAADSAGTITLSEGTGLAALGLKPGETVGRSVFDFSNGDSVMEANTRRALAGESVSYDAQYGALCLHVELRPQHDATGAVTGIIGVCFDITERAQSEERFRVLFEQSSDAHMLVGKTIIDCNHAAVSLLRCTDKAHLLALHPAALSPERQLDGQLSREKGPLMEAAARQKGSHRFEWIHCRMDGEEFPAEVTLTPVTLQGEPVMLAVWHDLTEQKKAEQEVRDYSVVLEFQKSQLEEVNRELEALATTDGLTGLKNHRTFQEKLAEEYARAVRYHLPLSLLLLDVDQFKQYNDKFGHPAGDAVLKQVADLLGRTARDTDITARYGGEEFVVVLPQTDEAGALVIAERIRAVIADADWSLRPITVSLGICTLSLDTPNAGALVACADQALYHSKEMGRNRVSHGNHLTPCAGTLSAA